MEKCKLEHSMTGLGRTGQGWAGQDKTGDNKKKSSKKCPQDGRNKQFHDSSVREVEMLDEKHDIKLK